MQLQNYEAKTERGDLKIETSEDWLVFIKEDNIVSDGQMVDIDAKLRGLGKTWTIAPSH